MVFPLPVIVLAENEPSGATLMSTLPCPSEEKKWLSVITYPAGQSVAKQPRAVAWWEPA
jgi:hypothetical protein